MGRVSGVRGVFRLSGVPFHVVVLALGAAFLLIDAFHGNVWFDESYSVAIARHSFADIWAIGSNDVHPVLFYWCLHILYLVFGESILAYRLFAIAGMISLATLGLTHVRRDFGWKAGLAFTFLVPFTPYLAIEGSQIRMYSWAAFAVMVSFLYAWRIFGAVRKRDGNGSRRSESDWRGARVPRRWWVALFLASLASAYLHYFAAIAAFVVNLLLFAYLLARARACARHLAVFLTGAFIDVLLYSPWLVEVARQMAVVGGTYWAVYQFPLTFIEQATYLFLTAPVSFAARGSYGVIAQVLAIGLCSLLLVVAVIVVVYLAVRGVRAAACGLRRAAAALPSWACSDRVLACVAGFAVYVGVFAIGWAASILMDSLIIYYRYLVVAVGPLLLAVALLIARVESRALAGAACTAVLGLAILNQALLVQDSYSRDNAAPLEYFDRAVEAVAEADAADAEPLVLSSDIGIQGVFAVQRPAVAQTYLDWQPGNWGAAYRSYAPTLSSVESWGDALAGFHGRFIVLGQTQDGSEPKDLADIQSLWKAQAVEQQTFYRPYERTWFTIAVCEIEG